jgi:hypothetical protein
MGASAQPGAFGLVARGGTYTFRGGKGSRSGSDRGLLRISFKVMTRGDRK